MALKVYCESGVGGDHRQLLEVLKHTGAIVAPVAGYRHCNLRSTPAFLVGRDLPLENAGLVSVDVDV